MHAYTYIHIYVCVCVCVCVYAYDMRDTVLPYAAWSRIGIGIQTVDRSLLTLRN